jgi:5'-nucleotidase
VEKTGSKEAAVLRLTDDVLETIRRDATGNSNSAALSGLWKCVAIVFAGWIAFGAVPGGPIGAATPSVHVRLLAFNDFHGQISAGRSVDGRSAGGAPVFAAYLEAAQIGMEDHTFLVNAGDNIGASWLSSALLHDEPTIMFYNRLANEHCGYERRADVRCNFVATLGNHEFDQGLDELLRLVQGGNHPGGPFLESPWRGARFAFISANAVDARSGAPIFPPYLVKSITYPGEDGVPHELPIGFIGAVLKDTPTLVPASGVAGIRFLDEAAAINRYVEELRDRGIRTIIVLIHQGGTQTRYGGPTDAAKAGVTGEIVDIVKHLDDEVDVVISGHTHAFTNALVKNDHGKDILVTQAFAYGTAYAEIDLDISASTGDVVARSASIVTTYADAGPGLTPDPAAAALTDAAERKVAPVANRVVGSVAVDITRLQNEAGESALGDLVADAQRAAMGTDFAFMNAGGLRADLRPVSQRSPPVPEGTLTYGDLFAIHPFANRLISMELTGQQIYELLEQQFPPHQRLARMLQISGLDYTWDASPQAAGHRIVEVRTDGRPIDRSKRYTVTANSFLAGGGEKFTVLTDGTDRREGPVDLDAVIAYLANLKQPVIAPVRGSRILRREAASGATR